MRPPQAKNGLRPGTWVDRHADFLFNFAISRVNDTETAKDLVQETFFAGLKSAANYKGEASERTWLVAILKRKIIDHYRKMGSKKGKAEVRMDLGALNENGEWLEERVANLSGNFDADLVENEELGLAIQNCIVKLPQKQAQVFTMKTIRQMETEDICNELHITTSNLWVMIHRARTALVDCLNQNWFES